MSDLARRCEEAQGADRALDWEIHLRNGLEGVGAYGCHPRYTESLDAAASLIPDGYDWVLERVNDGMTTSSRVGHNDPDRAAWGETPALALCAGALHAEKLRT